MTACYRCCVDMWQSFIGIDMWQSFIGIDKRQPFTNNDMYAHSVQVCVYTCKDVCVGVY